MRNRESIEIRYASGLYISCIPYNSPRRPEASYLSPTCDAASQRNAMQRDSRVDRVSCIQVHNGYAANRVRTRVMYAPGLYRVIHPRYDGSQRDETFEDWNVGYERKNKNYVKLHKFLVSIILSYTRTHSFNTHTYSHLLKSVSGSLL